MSAPLEQRGPNPPPRILVRGVNWLGDAIMTIPGLLRLRERFPDSPICLLSPEKLTDLWQHHKAISEVIPISAGESPFAIGRKLRSRHFDIGLVLPNSTRSALELWWARVPRRVGYARPWRNLLLGEKVAEPQGFLPMHKRSLGEIQRLISASPLTAPGAQPAPAFAKTKSHHIHHYLHLVASLGANSEPLPPQLNVTAAEVDAVVRKFGLAPLRGGERMLFGINPGAEYGPAKRWPIDRFVATARTVGSRLKCTWLIFGGVGDVEIASHLALGLQAEESAVRNLAGQTSLRELCALLKICRLLLTNDTGPMHVAAAVDTPVVALFGSTSPAFTAPGLPGDTRHRLLDSQVPCAPCFRGECPIDFRCMQGITVDRVVGAVLSVAASR
jgi:heptosyltransferase-2